MFIKLVFKSEIHLYKGDLTLKILTEYVKKVFKQLPKYYIFSYIDQQGDKITVNTQEDIIGIQSNNIKLYIEQSQQFPYLNGEQEDQQYDFLTFAEEPKIQKNDEMNCQKSLIKQDQQENTLLRDITRKFVQNLGRKAISKVIEEQDSIAKQCVADFLGKMYSKATQKAIQDTEQQPQQKLKMIESIQIKEGCQVTIKQKRVNKGELQILVEKKLLQLVPTIIDQIYQKIEEKLTQKNCINCAQSQLELMRLINKQLMRKRTEKLNTKFKLD